MNHTRSGSSASETNASRQSHPDLPIPPEGWGNELRLAQKALKKKPEYISNLLRVSRAHRMLRKWEHLNVSTNAALHLFNTNSDDSYTDEIRSELTQYRKEAIDALTVKSIISNANNDFLQEYYQEVMKLDIEVDQFDGYHWPSERFNNLNYLQMAAVKGDIRLLEKIVSLGAAIDHSPKPESIDLPGDPAPPSCTALVQACAYLAEYGVISSWCSNVDQWHVDMFEAGIKESVNRVHECAIQLVRRGADFEQKLTIPDNFTGEVVSSWRELGRNNKTARELAVMSGKNDLVETMDAFSNEDSRIEKAYCRCGSRLPWRDCHVPRCLPKITVFHQVSGSRRSYFQYSPLAP